MHLVTKRLYPMVAQRVGTNPHNIERNIRTVIEAFWRYGNKEYLRQITHRPIADKPRVKEFIDLLAGYLQHCEQHV